MDITWVVVGVLLVVLRTADAAGGKYGITWSYSEALGNGPSKWSVNASDCGKSAQSPVNILTKHAIYKKLELDLEDYDSTSSDVYFYMKNRNTDIAFEAKHKTKNTLIPQSVKFQGVTYRFYQFHFHWGSKNYQGSEHTLDSQRFAAEMHMIHYNTKYADVSAAAGKSDGLLVWGHFLKVDSVNKVANQDFQNLLDKFSGAINKGNSTKVTNLNLKALLPVPYSDFYHYKGSLTTPGCHESVQWVVNRNTISVSENQMMKFRQLKNNALASVETLEDNFRPTQPLNGRKVYRNFEYETSASVAVKPSLFILSTIAILMFAL